ncbi:FAD/NAD(P)-binding domain-containing protein [Winogradskyella sp. SYSU M77433]|uniref:FAD/NAD(P)-binding protein n=1 Tax=Winogradskyella sp. SYSU M77433 TaxID=3042722 RepID=UPI002480F16B|nr:FAD/NAD(P)-binding domain-containing protein [Winogradskyella sp. SYSU M77433]MDH7912376.1 FAD/NAD(P)-binding protein [Winogradskyella sp. SYSU M77433]
MKALTIIGFGPRGLYALERLVYHLAMRKQEINILVFESKTELGTGAAWNKDQPNSNLINITERALVDLPSRPKIVYRNTIIPQFPSYHQWCEFSQNELEPDTFPPRKKVGKYLSERANSIIDVLKSKSGFELFKTSIKSIDLENNKLALSSDNKVWKVDDVLLSIGHQSTKNSEQLNEWIEHSKSNTEIKVYENTYPVSLFKDIKNQTNISIGIRGFGLSLIDVMRYLTINDFGNFKITDDQTFETLYYKVKDQQLQIVPFSLDGLPLVPKPLNEHIDNWYKPTDEELEYFKTSITSVAQTSKNFNTIDFLIKPIAEISSRVFLDLGDKAVSHNYEKKEIESVVLNWLQNKDHQHPTLQNNNISTYNLIKSYIEMALGETKITLDYCVGQVWRHCQPTLYDAFSYANLKPEIIEDVIAQDEQSKRYSYGPPIESMQQLLALVDAGILNLNFVNNPDIELENHGWRLTNESQDRKNVNIMINSVLDSPKLLEVNSPLVTNLLQHDLISPIHSKLGIETDENAYVETENKKNKVNIAVLGRLAKGSVIGVDAILECFGSRIDNWAKAYSEKVSES